MIGDLDGDLWRDFFDAGTVVGAFDVCGGGVEANGGGTGVMYHYCVDMAIRFPFSIICHHS